MDDVPGELAAQGITLRPQTGGDLDFIRRLYVSLRWAELEPLITWTEAQKTAFLEQQFALQHRHYTTHYGDSDFMIVERHGVPIGRLYLHRSSPRELRIVDIGLLPAWRGQGLGTALLTAVLTEATAAGKIVSIHVEAFNPARRLYQRLGFTDVEQRDPYWLMHWTPPRNDAVTDPPPWSG